MDVLIIAGLSKVARHQLDVIHEITKDGMVMNYTNLQRYFGLKPDDNLSDYNTPYLSGIYLYNYLSRRGIRCGLINFLDKEIDRFKNLLQQSPKVIALSSTFLTDIQSIKKVTKIIRQYAPDVKIILGGPLVLNSFLLYQLKDSDYETGPCAQDYFFLNKDECHYEDIDLFVIEEQGEETLWKVIDAIKKCRDYMDIPNLAYYKNNQLLFTARKTENNNFAEDLVDWDQIPDEYLYPIFPLRGSRGCPFRCRYCNFASYRSFRLKSSEILEKEVAALANTGRVKLIRFTDDNLFLSSKHLEEYCRKILKVGKGIRWSSFIRANSISKDNIELLRDSGCISTMIGIESGNKNILKNMNKEETPEHYLEVVELLNRHGISTRMTLFIGFPGETPETIEDTANLLNQLYYQGPAINEVTIFPFVLLPLSPVYEPENRKKYGLDGYMMNWSHYTMNSEEARKYADELFLRLDRVHHHYGIEEFIMLNMAKLKRLAELRSKIRKAECSKSPADVINSHWAELKRLIVSE